MVRPRTLKAPQIRRYAASVALVASIFTATGAWAAPRLQACSPMELNSSSSGLTYTMACSAGEWKLKYSGVMPAGDGEVTLQYRLEVRGPDGAAVTENRSARLPATSMLALALLRDAVLLDNGDLALHDCPEITCARYRPLASSSKLAASLALPPEAQRLQGERDRAARELEQTKVSLTKECAATEAQLKIVRQRDEQVLSAALHQVAKLELELKQLHAAAKVTDDAASIEVARLREAIEAQTQAFERQKTDAENRWAAEREAADRKLQAALDKLAAIEIVGQAPPAFSDLAGHALPATGNGHATAPSTGVALTAGDPSVPTAAPLIDADARAVSGEPQSGCPLPHGIRASFRAFFAKFW